MERKKAILWDNDGLLADTERFYFEATKNVLSRVGISLTERTYVDYSLTQGRSLFDLAAAKGLRSGEIEKLRSQRNEMYSDYLRLNDVRMPGIEDVLKRLHGKAVMGVITTSRRPHFDIIHAKTGMLKYFDFFITREDYANSKPRPDPYLKGIKMSGHNASECVAVEDSERGLRSAVAAGLDCVVMPSGLAGGGDFTGAVKIVKNPEELLAFLGKIVRF